jgi:hypothetical protein
MEVEFQEPVMASLPNLVEAIRQITPAERAELMGELARAITEDLGGTKDGTMLRGPEGNAVGLFLPAAQNPPVPPPMTEADRAELQRRLDTIDDSMTTEELKARIGRGGVAISSRS